MAGRLPADALQTASILRGRFGSIASDFDPL